MYYHGRNLAGHIGACTGAARWTLRFHNPRFQEYLLQSRKSIDAAVPRLRVRAGLQEIVGGLLDKCP